jgi:hypothetical protein
MPVEISNRIGTIGDAHSNPDATRINLGYNPFRILISCCYRTDLYAWWLITMHAGNGNKAHLHIGIGSLYFADEIHPELCSPKFGLFFSYKWNVIFLPARYYTGLTACAFIQINHHSPAVSTFCVHSFHIGEVGKWGDREDPI